MTPHGARLFCSGDCVKSELGTKVGWWTQISDVKRTTWRESNRQPWPWSFQQSYTMATLTDESVGVKLTVLSDALPII